MLEKKDNIIYANFMSLNYSLYEVRLQFGIETPGDSNEDSNQVVLADIRMSPQLAKKMNEILSQGIENYEKNVGIIPTSD